MFPVLQFLLDTHPSLFSQQQKPQKNKELKEKHPQNQKSKQAKINKPKEC